MGMTEQEIRAKILELLAGGEFTKKHIKEALWIESDRKLENVLGSLMRDGLVYYDPSSYKYTLHKIIRSKTPRKAPKTSGLSIGILRGIFAILAIGASSVSIRNTSRYLLESYPVLWGITISVLMSLFMISAASMVVFFWSKKKYFSASGLAILWAIVTIYSMASTSIGMYNAQKESFITKTTVQKVESRNQLLYQSYVDQEADIQKIIDDKTVTLNRYNEDIKKFEVGSKDYANMSWQITVTERAIAEQQKLKTNIADSRIALLTKDDVNDIVIAKSFYEEMESIFGIKAALIQFVLSLFASIFIDIIAPIGASLALFLKEK
jgi:hypothetical protein